MARKPLIAGNWKMNLNHLEAVATVQKLAFALPKEYYEKVDVAVTVPFTDIRSVQTVVEGDKLSITYGAQDVSQHASGAYTGEVSAEMLAKLGCAWVVVGHSERREYHGETDEQVAAKAKAALAKGSARSSVLASRWTSARQVPTCSMSSIRPRHPSLDWIKANCPRP